MVCGETLNDIRIPRKGNIINDAVAMISNRSMRTVTACERGLERRRTSPICAGGIVSQL
jgi:hypothetical protein